MNGSRSGSVGGGMSGAALPLLCAIGMVLFLVLIYVFVMQPREAAKYDQLRDSIDHLSNTIAKNQSLVIRAKAEDLEDLYVLAVGPRAADLIALELASGDVSPEQLQRKLEQLLIDQTDSLSGLTREDGKSISDILTHKIRRTKIARSLAKDAARNWSGSSRERVGTRCHEALTFALRRPPSAP